MTPAYNELYLTDAMHTLANAFDYAINICNCDANWFASLFVNSGIALQFEYGNPSIISGMSGEELVKKMLSNVYHDKKLPDNIYILNRSKEYWAGWALAQYQWTTNKRFKDIFDRISLQEIINMYYIYHEMDITNFIERINNIFEETTLETNLKQIRTSRGLSQSELANKSGVTLRSIQLYEQKANDIDKAQVHALYKLSRALGCSIEDLLESPEQNK